MTSQLKIPLVFGEAGNLFWHFSMKSLFLSKENFKCRKNTPPLFFGEIAGKSIFSDMD
jgi:hypothetical protein